MRINFLCFRVLWIYTLIGLPFALSAQQSNFGNWLAYLGNKKIDGKWNWHHEVQLRNYNALGDLEQLLLRTGIGYQLGENSNVLLGYGFVHSQSYAAGTEEKLKTDEQRIFQQFITRQKVGRVALQHRYRFEERWIEGDFKFRVRYALGLQIPLNHQAMSGNTFYVSVYDEIFLHTISGAAFDRNRLFAGLGYQLNAALRFELGYLNQFLADSNRDQLNVAAAVQF